MEISERIPARIEALSSAAAAAAMADHFSPALPPLSKLLRMPDTGLLAGKPGPCPLAKAELSGCGALPGEGVWLVFKSQALTVAAEAWLPLRLVIRAWKATARLFPNVILPRRGCGLF